MSIILAADTSTSVCTIAICKFNDQPNTPSTILAETIVEAGRLHAERIIGMIDWALQAANLTLPDIDTFAVGIGPGSFTGLRIGVATLKGLALGTSSGLIGVSTLDALAHAAPIHNGTLAVMLDARMDEVFGARYTITQGQATRTTEQRACPVEKLLPDTQDLDYCLGDGATLYAEKIRAAQPNTTIDSGLHSAPRASAVAAVAHNLLQAGATPDPATVAPVYIRASQAEVNRDQKKRNAESQATRAQDLPVT